MIPPMAKHVNNLQVRMPPDSRARREATAERLIREMALDELRAVFPDGDVRITQFQTLVAPEAERDANTSGPVFRNRPSAQGHMLERVHQRRSAMSQTLRQMIIDILLERPATAKELSAHVHIPEKDVFQHLAHIRKSLHHRQQRLVMDPACCRACGFVFQKRERFRKPGRCPSCHHSFIEAPVFRIQA